MTFPLTIFLLVGALWAQGCRPNIALEQKGADYYALPSWDKALTFIQPADVMEGIAPNLAFVLSQPQFEPPAMRGTFYCSWIEGDGGNPPYTYSASGLPFGLAVDAISGQITGIPLARGVYQQIVYTVTDSSGATATIQRMLRVCGVEQYCNGFN